MKTYELERALAKILEHDADVLSELGATEFEGVEFTPVCRAGGVYLQVKEEFRIKTILISVERTGTKKGKGKK